MAAPLIARGIVGMGWIWTVLLNGGLGVGAYWVSRFGLRQPSGLPRVLATVLLAWGWLTVGMESLGSIGLMAREPLLCWVGAGLVIGLGCKLWVRDVRDAETARLTARSLSWKEIGTLGLVVWATVGYARLSFFGPVKVISDGPIYHLYFAARWWKSGRLELIPTPFGENAATYFPAVGDLWFAWLIIGWGGELLAKVGQVPFLAVSGLTIIAIARQLGAGRSAALIATAWALTSSPLLAFSTEPNVDTIFMSGYLLSAYFFLRHALGEDGRASLALGGLAAGCALATKAPAFVFVIPLLSLGVASAMRGGKTVAGTFLSVLIILFATVSVAGFWFARNMLLTGNPLYPLHLAGFGRVWFAGWYGPEAMRFSQYYLSIDDWRALIDVILAVIDPRLAPVWLAALLGAWSWKRISPTTRDRWVWVASGLAAINVLLYWFVIPYRTQQRFMFHAVALAAIPLARLLDRGAKIRTIGLVLLVIHLFTHQSWPFPNGDPPWDLSSEVPNRLPGLIYLPTRQDSIAAFILFFIMGLASLAVVWVVGRSVTGPTTQRRALAVASLLIYAFGVSYMPVPWRNNSRQVFFPAYRDYYPGWLELDARAGPSGARIAYAGTNLPYYLLGVNLRNDVRYVNVDAHRGWLMHDYHLEAMKSGSGPAICDLPRPRWDRAHPDYLAWLANLRAERIQLLVVTQNNAGDLIGVVDDPPGFPIERQWADDHPEAFELLYGEKPIDPKFRLYRVKVAPEQVRDRNQHPGASSGQPNRPNLKNR
jgi:Dolichyl-phosphate-mannose-protein mannosyltransferase